VDGAVFSKAAGESLRRWLPAWVQSRGVDAARDPAGSPRAPRFLSSSWLIALLALLGMGAVLLCIGIDYGLARQSDERMAADQRAMLRGSIAEFGVQFGSGNEVDPRLVTRVQQSTGLRGLRFETDPPPSAREMQPVVDAQGRIIGFFTWQQTQLTMLAMNWLMPLLAVVAVALVAFVGFALWQLQRARRNLADTEERARRAFNEDKLTGLPNHAGMLELLAKSLATRTGDQCVIFALLELDGFDDVNGHVGVTGGSELMIAVAKRLREELPAGATCGRVGHDDFAVIIPADADIDFSAAIRPLMEAVSHPHWIDSVVRIGAHAGVAVAPRDGTGSEDLVRRAELAMRTAAQKGPGTLVLFERSIDAAAADQQFIRRELPRALSAGELELHYQPIVSSQGSRIVGVEALLRWTHSTRGPIGPAVFIPVAEQMGLMDKLGAFVLRRALEEARRWPDIYVAVNLSPLQVRDRSIVDLVRTVLTATGVVPQRLMLEVTEGVLIDNPDEMVKRIEDLRALGVRIALDDFGSGYSNLGYLQRFPFDKLKIDRSFVAALGRSSNGGVIIQAIVALGRALGVSVLVEGVETEEQRVLLRLAGCDEMQGFLFAKPSPAKIIDRLLAERQTGAGQALTA
jgi:diguanylate cyclase (GGDEF)-like protein